MDIIVPQVGESIVEAEIGAWFKQDGDQVAADEVLLELETEKVNIELNAEAAGKLTILAQQGETIKIGAVIGRIDTSAVGADQQPPSAQPPAGAAPGTQPATAGTPSAQPAAAAASTSLPPVNPAVPKLAAERGIDLATVTGSGRDGRILVDDLPAAGQSPAAEPATEQAPKAAAPANAAVAAPAAAATPAVPADERITRVPMTQIRKKTAERLLQARQQTAMLTTFNEIDMQRLIALRTSHKESFQKKHAVGLGFMSFFIKACAESLKEFPDVNARIDGTDIVYHNYFDIGVAVGSKRGLAVPIIRNADHLHFAAIETTIRDFAERAGTGKLQLDELQGGTFTISNGGVYGSVLSTPLLNPPQSAILGMHAIKDRAVVVDGEIVVRPIMNVALSYDHRIIDGQQAVSFLQRIKNYIEDPEEMLLEM